jgi:hypothetical protein
MIGPIITSNALGNVGDGCKRRSGARPLSSADAESTIVVTNHGVDAPVLRVLQLLKDGSIERLAHTEHPSFAGTHFGAKPHHELLISALRQRFHVYSLLFTVVM